MTSQKLSIRFFALAIAALFMSAGLVQAYTLKTVVDATGVTGHDGGNWNPYYGHLTDMLNGSDPSILDPQVTDTPTPGMTVVDPADPATWTWSGSYKETWHANSLLSGTPSGKIGWAVVDFGSTVNNLSNAYLWASGGTTDPEKVQDYKLWYSNGVGINALPAMPQSKSTTGDYDFTVGDWAQIGGTNTLGTASGSVSNTLALGDISAQYIGIEVMTLHGAGTRMAVAQMEFASGVTAHAWTLNGNGNWNDAANWDETTFPDGIDAIADFSTIDITNHRSVNVEAPVTVGSLMLGDTNGSGDYKFYDGTAGTLTFDVSSGNATLSNNSGRANAFNNTIILNDTLEISDAVSLGGATISGTGGIIYNGTGTLDMRGTTAGQYSYTGDTVVNSGVYLGSNAYDGNLAPGNLKINEAKYQGYYNASLLRPLGTGAGQFQLTGGTAAGFNYNNNLTVKFGNDASNVAQWGSAVFDPGTLLLANTRTSGGGDGNFYNILDLNGAARTIDVTLGHAGLEWYMRGEIRDTAGGASLIKTGNGRLSLAAANTWAGGIAINEGIVQASNASALGIGGPVSFGGATATLDLRSDLSIGALSSASGNGTVTVGDTNARTLTVDQDTDTSFGGVLTDGTAGGTLSLIKEGSGLLAITGDATYTGTTAVNAGALIIDGDFSAATGQVNVASGARLGGNGTFGGTVVLASGAGLVLDTSKTLTINGGTVDLGYLSLADLMVTGPLSFGVYTLMDGTATFDFTNVQNLGLANIGTIGGRKGYFQEGSLDLVVIPEPSTIILAGLGLLGVTFRRRRSA